MTEEEAKTKTCHKTLAAVAVADDDSLWFSSQNCIGSACMAWRVEHYENIAAALKATAHGFCGLAGRP